MKNKYLSSFGVDDVIRLLQSPDVIWEPAQVRAVGAVGYTSVVRDVATIGRVLPEEVSKEIFKDRKSIELQEYGRILDQRGVDQTFVRDYTATIFHLKNPELSILEFEVLGEGSKDIYGEMSCGEHSDSYMREFAVMQQKVGELYRSVDQKLRGR